MTPMIRSMSTPWQWLAKALLATALVHGPAAMAQGAAASYPQKPIKILVGFSPGGVPDIVARVLGPDAMLWDQICRGVAYAPAYTIMGGTSNVMRNILGERVLGLAKG